LDFCELLLAKVVYAIPTVLTFYGRLLLQTFPSIRNYLQIHVTKAHKERRGSVVILHIWMTHLLPNSVTSQVPGQR